MMTTGTRIRSCTHGRDEADIPDKRAISPSRPITPITQYPPTLRIHLERFDGLDITDAQMTRYDKTYSTSKYAANAVITELDSQIASASGANANDHTAEHEENSGRRRTRCLLAEPAIVQTSVGSANFAGLWVLGTLIEAFQWLTFVLVRRCLVLSCLT